MYFFGLAWSNSEPELRGSVLPGGAGSVRLLTSPGCMVIRRREGAVAMSSHTTLSELREWEML